MTPRLVEISQRLAVDFSRRRQSQRYVKRVLKRLAMGDAHPTLGSSTTPLEGLEVLTALMELGLRQADVVVDFGCGSLRSGRHLIAHLDADCYWGLDVSDAFFRPAFHALPRTLADRKRPKLRLISTSTLTEVAAASPSWLIACGVLQCIATRHLHAVFGDVARLSGANTHILATLLEADTSRAITRTSFRHSISDVRAAAKRAGLAVDVIRQGVEPIALREGGISQLAAAMGMVRDAATLRTAEHSASRKGLTRTVLDLASLRGLECHRTTVLSLRRRHPSA